MDFKRLNAIFKLYYGEKYDFEFWLEFTDFSDGETRICISSSYRLKIEFEKLDDKLFGSSFRCALEDPSSYWLELDTYDYSSITEIENMFMKIFNIEENVLISYLGITKYDL